MAISVSQDDPIVFWQVYGQPYAAKVVATDSGDPPILTLAVGQRQFANVSYDAAGQAPNTWCRYSDPGRPGTLPDPDLVITTAQYITQADADARYLTPTSGDTAFLTQAEADARYLTQAQADDLYAPATP